MANENVLFLRGLQGSIPKDGEATNGAFYLTSDTHRLYVGEDNNAVLLNQTINFVDSLAALAEIQNKWENPDKHLGDMYYIRSGAENTENTQAGNILAVWDNVNGVNKWVQINPDTNTQNTGLTTDVAQGTGSVTLTTSLTDNRIDDNIVSDDLIIEAGKKNGKATVTVTATPATIGDYGVKTADAKVTITGDTYTLSAADASAASAKVKLSSALGQGDTSVTIKAGTNVYLDDNATNGIVINAKDWVPSADDSTLSLNNEGKLELSLSNGVAADNAIVITSDVVGYTLNNQTVALGSTLDVYTTEQVDKKLRALDGMTYCGTIGGTGTEDTAANFEMSATFIPMTRGTTTAIDVHKGDTFKVVNSVKYNAAGDTAKLGDMLIATGEEYTEADVAAGTVTSDQLGVLKTITWTFIPSGDDFKEDTQYVFSANATNNKLSIQSSTSEGSADAGSIQLIGGNKINLSSTGSNGNLVTTVNHNTATVTENATINSGAAADNSITVLTAIGDDGYGHIASTTKTKFTLPSYSLGDVTVTNGSTTANGKTKYKVTIQNGLVKDTEDAVLETGFTLNSESLHVTAADNDVTVELKWGTF